MKSMINNVVFLIVSSSSLVFNLTTTPDNMEQVPAIKSVYEYSINRLKQSGGNTLASKIETLKNSPSAQREFESLSKILYSNDAMSVSQNLKEIAVKPESIILAEKINYIISSDNFSNVLHKFKKLYSAKDLQDQLVLIPDILRSYDLISIVSQIYQLFNSVELLSVLRDLRNALLTYNAFRFYRDLISGLTTVDGIYVLRQLMTLIRNYNIKSGSNVFE